MLSDLGMYSEQCSPDLAPNELCKSQESRLAVLWTVGIFALNCGPVIMGFVLDYLGPKVTGAIGALLNILGLILFAVGKSSHGPRSFVPGAIFLGLGGITFHLAQFHASALFPRHRGLVASALVAGFTGSGIVMYLLLLIFQGCGSTRGAYLGVLLGYAGICALWIPLSLWTMPNDPFRVGQVFLFRTHDWSFEVRRRADLEQLYSRGTALQDFIAARGADGAGVDRDDAEAGTLARGWGGRRGAGGGGVDALPSGKAVELSLRAGADGRVLADIHAAADSAWSPANGVAATASAGAAAGEAAREAGALALASDGSSAPALIDLDHAPGQENGGGASAATNGDVQENDATGGKGGKGVGADGANAPSGASPNGASKGPNASVGASSPPSFPSDPNDPYGVALSSPSPSSSAAPDPPPRAIALTSLSSDPPPPPAPALPAGVAWGPLVFEARRFVTLRKKTFLEQLRSPESFGMGVFYTTNMFMMQLYLGSMRLQLSNKGDSNNAYSNFGNVVVAFAFLSMPLIAWLLDAKGYGATLGTINAMGVVTSLLQALPWLHIQAITIVLWMVGRFFMYASYFAIFGALFGFTNFGRLVAVDNTTNGVVGLLQYPITYLAIHALDGSFWIINLCQAAILLPLFFFCAAMRRWERDDLVPIRPMEGEELPCDMVGMHRKKELKNLKIAETLHLDRLPESLGLDKLHLERLPEALGLDKLHLGSGGRSRASRTNERGAASPPPGVAPNPDPFATHLPPATPGWGTQGAAAGRAGARGTASPSSPSSPDRDAPPAAPSPPPPPAAPRGAEHHHGSDDDPDAPPTDADLRHSWGGFFGWGARSRGTHGEDKPLHTGQKSDV